MRSLEILLTSPVGFAIGQKNLQYPYRNSCAFCLAFLFDLTCGLRFEFTNQAITRFNSLVPRSYSRPETCSFRPVDVILGWIYTSAIDPEKHGCSHCTAGF